MPYALVFFDRLNHQKAGLWCSGQCLSQGLLSSRPGIVIALSRGVPDKKSEKSSFFLNFF
jgi:hypothetical protein